jgi:hypothetical protein
LVPPQRRQIGCNLANAGDRQAGTEIRAFLHRMDAEIESATLLPELRQAGCSLGLSFQELA